MSGIPSRNRWLLLLTFLHLPAVAFHLVAWSSGLDLPSGWMLAAYLADAAVTVFASAAALPHAYPAASRAPLQLGHSGFRMAVPWSQRVELRLYATLSIVVAGALGLVPPTMLSSTLFIGVPVDGIPNIPGVMAFSLMLFLFGLVVQGALATVGLVPHLVAMPGGEVQLQGRRLTVGKRHLTLSSPTLSRQGARLVVSDRGEQITVEAADATLDWLVARIEELPELGGEDEVPRALRDVVRPQRQRE